LVIGIFIFIFIILPGGGSHQPLDFGSSRERDALSGPARFPGGLEAFISKGEMRRPQSFMAKSCPSR
jgi:hypothetical protein